MGGFANKAELSFPFQGRTVTGNSCERCSGEVRGTTHVVVRDPSISTWVWSNFKLVV